MLVAKLTIPATRNKDQSHGCVMGVAFNIRSKLISQIIRVVMDVAYMSFIPGVSKATEVSLRVSTTNLRVKTISSGDVLFDVPLFRVTYCGTDKKHKEAFRSVPPPRPPGQPLNLPPLQLCR